MKLRIAVLIATGLLVGSFHVRAEEPQPPADQKTEKAAIPANESPEAAMLRITDDMEKLDLDQALGLYDYSTDLEKQWARASCKYGLAITRVELAARKQFGRKQADQFVHAIQDRTDEDVKQATFKVDGDKAAVQFAGDTEPTSQLVRVKGVWKLDAHFFTKDLPESAIKQDIKTYEAIARDAAPFAEKVEKGEYKDVDSLAKDLNTMINLRQAEGMPDDTIK